MRVADLKRLPVGTKLRLVRSLLGPCDTLRSIHRVNSNTIEMMVLEGPKAGSVSWLPMPKASQFTGDDKGFTITEDGKVCAQYLFVT